MLGGYQILDLRAIDLTIGTSASNITNADVLKQLRELRNHIQKDYNFAKPLNNQLKPILIRYRDKKNGEKHEATAYGLLEVLTNYYTFKINALNNGEKLSIEVVFEEKTDEYENKYWDIKTAKVLLSQDEAIGGDASIGGDMSVTGDASIGGDMSVTGDASIGGDLGVTGKVSGKIAFEDIEDALGHKRFIEGDILPIAVEGVEYTFTKWSLSGTHLLIVIAFTIASGTSWTGGAGIRGDILLPTWIKDKIVPTIPNGSYVDYKVSSLFNTSTGSPSAQLGMYLAKNNTNVISFTAGGFSSLEYNVAGRIQIDILIDNEQPNP